MRYLSKRAAQAELAKQGLYGVDAVYDAWIRGTGPVRGLTLPGPIPPYGLATDCGGHTEHSITSGTNNATQ